MASHMRMRGGAGAGAGAGGAAGSEVGVGAMDLGPWSCIWDLRLRLSAGT